MSTVLIYGLAGIGLFAIGLHGLLSYRHLLRKILALNIMGSGVFLVLAALATRTATTIPDPVPHAMIITGIVVAVAATALALVLMLKLTAVTGQPVLPDKHKETNT
ncbi:NADH-quinone oxidoreductase subunit K [Psychrobacter sp. 1U2]|uniref:NADH-quinone oxidoreductase subunit K n=1 Tax=unclassified Psychrobacter TaxID=196806 RepID=UPI003F46D6EE